MKLRVGILSFAHMHARSYAQALLANRRAHLVGISDNDTERGERSAREFGVRFFATHEELLAQKLDAVIITSENAGHRSLVELCASSGVWAILCEKPLATSAEDAAAMIQYCALHSVKLATAFPCRFSPAIRRLRDQIQSGTLGKILAIRGTNRGVMPGGWFTDKTLSGGGAVIDHTVHVADVNRWLLGKEAQEVYAEIGNGFFHQKWEDTGMLTVTYDGGTFATIDTSWSRPSGFPKGDLTLEVIGTAGVAQVDLFTQNVTCFSGKSDVTAQNWGSDIDRWMIEAFVRLAEGEDAPDLASGDDGLRALEVALAAYRSAGEHQPVSLTAVPA